jgi:hypothetical protein
MPDDRPLLSSSSITIDAIAYRMLIFEIGGQFHGEWICHGCGEHEVAVLRSPDLDTAVEQAQTGIEAHHRALHST